MPKPDCQLNSSGKVIFAMERNKRTGSAILKTNLEIPLTSFAERILNRAAKYPTRATAKTGKITFRIVSAMTANCSGDQKKGKIL
jgi:hypothetical protein